MQNNNYNGNKICPQCKKEIGYYDKLCYHCGQEFEVKYEDERAAYIQKNVDTYFKKFDKINAKEGNASWNWCGFLFSYSWLIYRKMYGLCAIAFGVMFVLEMVVGLVLAFTGFDELVISLITSLIDLVFYFVIAIFGDHWYQKKINKLVEEGTLIVSDDAKAAHYRKGGVNVLAVVIITVLAVGVNLFL